MSKQSMKYEKNTKAEVKEFWLNANYLVWVKLLMLQ